MSERERRQHERVQRPVRVRFHDGKQKVETPLQNISKGGFFFLHDEVLHIGSIMDFELIQSSFTSPLKLKGRVIHLSSHQGDKTVGCGIEISGFDPALDVVWKQYLALLES